MKTYLFPAVLAGSLLVAQALSHASDAGDSISLLNIPNSQTDSALVLTPSASLGLEVGGGRAALAAELGFDDPFHFSRAFKNVLGLSPETFRRLR